VSDAPAIELNDGHEMPQIGLGVWLIGAAETAGAVRAALELGYRHFDTAQGYGNEAGVGEGVRASGIARDEVFITSKLANSFHEPADARREFAGTLSRLGSDDVDLFLIHWPVPFRYGGDFVTTWKVFEEFQREGRARSIGVSNFQPDHLQRLAAECDVVPAVNQVELHPHFANAEVRAYNDAHGIATEAWSPLGQGGAVLSDPAIAAIAARHDRTAAQIVLRWHVQHGTVAIPKSQSPVRMRENLDLFGFELDDDEMARIDALDRGEPGRLGGHPERFG
jgi:2,5-diketo-D-gluconate reductase A